MGGFVGHSDPLVEASNKVALTIGTHLPFWPLYVWWCAGFQWNWSMVATLALAPLFIAIPLLSRRHRLLARIATPVAGIANTLFTTWLLGVASGTELFFVPCAAFAAMLFRRSERWVMVTLAILPLVAWYVLLDHAPAPMHRYGARSLHEMYILNAASIGALLALFGWFHMRIYQRMEAEPPGQA